MNKKGEPAPPIPLRDGELVRREEGRVSVREGPLRVWVDVPELVTADGHRLQVRFGCAVQARPERAERQMLEEAFLSERGAASATDVARAFEPRLKEEAGRAVSGRAVVEWLNPDARGELVGVLRRAAEAMAFTTGLEVLPPYQVDMESPTLARLEQDRSARELAERAQAERLSHLRRSAEVLKEFNAIREASPGVSVSALIGRMAAGDQARVVQGLMEAGSRGAGTVYAVAGPYLVSVSPEGLALEEIQVPAEAGPFRSVQEIRTDGETRLALGGRGGVVVVDPAKPSEAVYYPAGEVNSAMGFNRVVIWDGRLWASHSEAGLVGWDLGERERPGVLIGREKLGAVGDDGPRHLQVVGNRPVFAIGAKVCAIDESLEVRSAEGAGSAETVVAMLTHPRGVIVVRASGEIEARDATTLKVTGRDRRSSRVTAAALLPFYDEPRLLLASEDGPVTCLSLDDAVVMQYASAHRGLRALAASAGTIAGISADRQRVVLLDVGQTGSAREAHVGARVKHRVADITFVR